MLIIALSTLILDWQHIATPTATVTALPVTKYLYDGDNVLADYASNEPGNALTATALYVTPELDQNLSVTAANGTTHYYTHDGLGSVRTLTNTNGSPSNYYDYSAFGEPYTAATSETVPNRYTYTGREKSPIATAPMYYRWRNYAPGIGRFLWRDPIGYAGGNNVYRYCHNRPLSLHDYFGLHPGYSRDDGSCYNDFCKLSVWNEYSACLIEAAGDFFSYDFPIGIVSTGLIKTLGKAAAISTSRGMMTIFMTYSANPIVTSVGIGFILRQAISARICIKKFNVGIDACKVRDCYCD